MLTTVPKKHAKAKSLKRQKKLLHSTSVNKSKCPAQSTARNKSPGSPPNTTRTSKLSTISTASPETQTISIPDAHMAFGPTSPNTQLFYPPTFSLPDIYLVEKYSKQTITTFSLHGLMKFGHPHISNALISANFLFKELPARYAQRIELLRDAPFDLNRHPLLQQIQYHYLQSLKLITAPQGPPTNIEELHQFNSNVLIPLLYQSSLLPSSVLSHALCTAFSDILLQQLILLQHILPSSQQVNDDSLPQPSKYIGAEAEQRRRTVYGILDDSSTSLQLFNALLQETLDSFNVSRLDTRLLMTQHLMFSSQLFKHMHMPHLSYADHFDPFSSTTHEGQYLSPDLIEFFEDNPNFITSFQSAEHSQELAAKDDRKELTKWLADKRLQRGETSPPPTTDQDQSTHHPSHFKIQEGYDGFIGICEINLKFSDVTATMLPYAAFQSATRFVEYLLFQEYHNFYQTGVIGEKTEGSAKILSPGRERATSSLTLPIMIKHLRLMEFTPAQEQWLQDTEELLKKQLKEQLEMQQKHPLMQFHDSVVLTVPPLTLSIPTIESLHAQFDEADSPQNPQNTTKNAKKTTLQDDLVDVVIPFPKVRISGDLSHSILYSRHHANLFIRELLGNSVENTMVTSFQLNKKHLLTDFLANPSSQQESKQRKQSKQSKQSQSDDDIDEPKVGANGKNMTLSDDGEFDTMGLQLSDYNHTHQTYLPPVDIWFVKASSNPESGEDDIFSIKVSDRANGVTRARSKAILTYGNRLIDTTLRTIRTYKQQQEQLNQHHQQVEQLRALHATSDTTAPFHPPPVPAHLQPDKLIHVKIPTNDSYSPTALFDMGLGVETDVGIDVNTIHTISNQGHKFPRGFGLPLAKAMVNYLNGDFILNSVDGFGTDVYLKLKV